jgi:hypothetical protein
MISLTRREFDTVSTALTDVWLEARRRDRLERLGLMRVELPKKSGRTAAPTVDARVLDALAHH